MKSQSAKFFCENCGSEVPQNAKVCRHCGRFFSSVRCPVCGTTGTNKKFENGCPTCGYAVGKGQKVKSPKNKEQMASRHSKKELKNAIDSRNPNTFARRARTDGTLPPWSILLIAAVLFGFIFGTMKYLEII